MVAVSLKKKTAIPISGTSLLILFFSTTPFSSRSSATTFILCFAPPNYYPLPPHPPFHPSHSSSRHPLSIPLFACSFILAKKLTETDPTRVIVGALTIIVTLMLLGPALLVWRTPTPTELGWLFATASFATAGHLTLVQAFRAAEITVTQPVAFLQLVWATLHGYYVFGETPDMFTWIGAAVIVSSATYIAHRELKNR